MKRNRTMLAAAGVMAVLYLLTLGAPIASADIVYTINVPNTALSPLTGPYATATVSLTTPTTALVTFQSGVVGGVIYLLNDVDVNVNAGTWTVGTFNASNSGTGFTPGPFSATNMNSENVSSFGVFNQKVNDFDGFKTTADLLSFVLTDTSGTWASAANVLTPNAAGYSVGAHIFATASPANANNPVIVTGFAANGGTSVPDGGMTLMLLGGALVGLETLRRKLIA